MRGQRNEKEAKLLSKHGWEHAPKGTEGINAEEKGWLGSNFQSSEEKKRTPPSTGG